MIKIKVFSLILILLLGTGELLAQNKTFQIKGKVVAENVAVDHATVRISGFDKTLMTNDLGEFELTLPSTGALFKIQISKVGYITTSREVGAQNNDTLLLEMRPDTRILEEVNIQTGYQAIPKERATGSFEQVNNKLFNRQIGMDVISRLDGIMPNLLFDKRGGNESNMILRGVGSLEGSQATAPLIVLDNFPFEGDLSSINPNDVESVTMLKDAAASSIWGAKAGNGVLVITTKKGSLSSKWRLSMTVNTTFTEKPDLFYLPQMTSSEFIDVERFLFDKGVFNNALSNNTTRPVQTPVVELLEKNRKGLISDDDLEFEIDRYRTIDLRDDLNQYFYRTGISQQYATSLSGGTDKLSSYISMGYDHNVSNAVGNRSKRTNLNVENTFKPLQKLEFRVGVRYAHLASENNNLGGLFMTTSRPMYPYADIVDELGNARVVEKNFRNNYLDQVDQQGHLLDWRYRPYNELSLADNNSNTNNLLLSGSVKYDLLPSLSADIQYQYNYQPETGRNHYSEHSFFSRNMINMYSSVTNNTVIRPVPIGGILDRSHSTLNSNSIRGQLAYSQDFNDQNFNAIGGMEIRDVKSSGFNNREYGYKEDLLLSSPVDYNSRFTQYDNLASASIIPFSNSAFGRNDRFLSFYFNGSYMLYKKYMLSASVRRDASNLFGIETNAKWNPLWSVGAAWNLHHESFMKESPLQLLKMRATYGYSGKVPAGYGALTTLKYNGISKIGRFPYAVVVNPPNPQLRWEKVATLNLGIDFALKGNWLSGSIEYYEKKSTDLIAPVTSNITVGYAMVSRNSATILNSGLDAQLHAAKKIGNLYWNGDLNISYNKNRILKYMLASTRLSNWVGAGVSVSPIEGQAAYPLISYKWGGLTPENGNPVGYLNGENTVNYAQLIQNVTKDDLIFHGSALPEYYGAFRNMLSWRNLSVSANISFKSNYYFRRKSIDYTQLLNANARVGYGDFKDRWQQPGDENRTTVPSMQYPVDTRRNTFYQNAEITAEKGDHIRLQDISISYLLANKSLSKRFKDLRLTAYLRNLGVLWSANKLALDPDFRSLPLPASYSLGLTSNF
ncbi:SusC/RagA family TonB-linked outer membrane protein [Sphingobacterium kitahiroshimense]|uniref:SusC/RagA family TonB-linked outer membrane protein n=1 Tax=Sphingobacterium sp. B16(2022) TaxID=2914044 RepID=UPI00143B396D|nr:SusC/RagA family TonB-linked outer membrane protein [Sphingobacterium sp. B16(2022)]NJI72439.1 SusC/RagA family TonB-linked outer membrane protein [Sphingobacterium sp. B16(2022)]